jgi:ligand-binding sensor domain-containing protein
MTQRLTPWVALCLLVLLGAMHPAAPAFAARWDTYTNANRLNSVRAVTGGVWAASDFGLHRYDPANGKFTRFAKAVGELGSNSIAEVELDGTGNTWFATGGKGVSVLLANGTWRALSSFDGLPSDTVTALEFSPAGMWVGTRRGLALFDGFTLAAVWPDGVNPSPFNSNVINDIAHVADSTYVATNDGVYVTKTDEGVVWQRRVSGLGNLTVHSVKGFGNEAWCVAGTDVYRGGQTGAWTLEETGLGGATVATLTARSGQMFAGGFNGVYRWDGTSSWQNLGGGGFPGNAWADVDPAGGIWAGNFEGLWRYDGAAWQLLQSAGPTGNWVQGMQLVGSTLWSATRDLGLSRFDGTSWRSYFPSAGATIDTTFYGGGSLFGLLADKDGTLWCGQWGAGLVHIDPRIDPPSFTHYYDPSEGAYDERNTFIWSSARDSAGNHYFGLDTRLQQVIVPIGINKVGTDESRTNLSPQGGQAMSGPQVRAIAFAPGAGFEMWVGYATFGVDVFIDPTLNTRLAHFVQTPAGQNQIPGLLSSDIWAIEFNGDDVWIATSSGLSLYSRASRARLQNVTTPSISSQGAVHPLSLDAQGGVWLATTSGVFHRRPDGSVELFTAENSPLLSNDVHSVIADKVTGDIWIGSVLGINRYNPAGVSGGGPTVAQGASFGVYPNPAFLSAAGTVIRATNLSGPFKGKVYDVHGRVVKRLLGNASTGVLWNGDDEQGQRVAPGVYFFLVQAGGVTRKSRVLLLR